MADYDVIVIGAGNGGLTSAATLAQKGVKVLVLEQHNIPGGCATSFCRGRFEFEVALHQLSGLGTAKKPGPLRGLLTKLDVMDKLEFVQMTDLYRMQIIPEDLSITLKPDREMIVEELTKHFPAEKQGIKGYMDLIYNFFTEAIGAQYMNDPDASPERYPLYFKYALKTTQQAMDSFIKDPTLKTVLSPYWSYIGLPPNKMNFHDMAAMIYGYCEFKPFHLKGGSQALSNAIADTIIRNGGTIHYNCAAKKIIVKDGKVQGVLTENEDEITAKYVISNASKISTYVDMMDEEHVPDAIRGELRQTSIAQGGFIIYMGLDCEPEEAGFTESTNFIFGNTDANKAYERMKVADINQDDFLLLSCYDLIDPSFSPEGTCQAALITLKYGDAWLRIPPAQYAAKKHECADAMLKVAGKLYPNLRNHIEEIEIATPITSMRYLGHPNGSFYGFEHHIKDSETFLPNESHIKGLYGAGGWVGLCGFQTTLDSGARIGRTIYKEINA